jgi:hypothetical protein
MLPSVIVLGVTLLCWYLIASFCFGFGFFNHNLPRIMFLNMSFMCKNNHILLIIKALTQKKKKNNPPPPPPPKKKSITISSPHNRFPQVANSSFEFLPPMLGVMSRREKIS